MGHSFDFYPIGVPRKHNGFMSRTLVKEIWIGGSYHKIKMIIRVTKISAIKEVLS